METKMASEGQDWVLAGKCVEFFPRGMVPADRAQYYIEHPDRLTVLILNALIDVGSLWNQLFGHLRVWNREFYEYPLEPETDEVVEEYGFDRNIVGTEAACQLKKMGYSLPGLRACGKYIKDHPRAQFEHPLVALGAKGQGDVRLPVFCWCSGQPDVSLRRQSDEFSSVCRFLVCKPSGQK